MTRLLSVLSVLMLTACGEPEANNSPQKISHSNLWEPMYTEMSKVVDEQRPDLTADVRIALAGCVADSYVAILDATDCPTVYASSSKQEVSTFATCSLDNKINDKLVKVTEACMIKFNVAKRNSSN